MFSNLKEGSKVYILLKPSDLKIGTVTQVTAPLQYMQYMPNQKLDIKVDVDNKILEFKQLPLTVDITFYDNGKIAISDNTESISNEILTMIKTSKEVIDSIPYHQEVIDKGEDLIKSLNPLYAQQKEQLSKINNLENKVGNMENKIDNITDMLTKLLNTNTDSKNN